MNYSLLTFLPSSFLARIVTDYSSEIGELPIGSLLEKGSNFLNNCALFRALSLHFLMFQSGYTQNLLKLWC
jgi:hypothetical protein